ncbi:MAG: hypothetical protein MI861_26920 [Pirellulales bacterium]|nr:hypothetical protein [Pirellulales bacterium]
METPATNPNPYQPPTQVGGVDPDAPIEADCSLNSRLWRKAEAQYLLQWHPHRLLFGSLTIIILCMIIVGTSYRFEPLYFFLSMIGMMLAAALIYLGMVHSTKIKLRRSLQEHGLGGELTLTVRSDRQQLTVIAGDRVQSWPNEQVDAYRTKHGLLICLEPMLYILVPKKSVFQVENYRTFARMIKSRVQGNLHQQYLTPRDHSRQDSQPPKMS